MREPKPSAAAAAAEDSAMESTFSGVLTRAKTLALQSLQKSRAAGAASSGSYLQLRSRRLEKPVTCESKRRRRRKQNRKQKHSCNQGQERCVQDPSPAPGSVGFRRSSRLMVRGSGVVVSTGDDGAAAEAEAVAVAVEGAEKVGSVVAEIGEQSNSVDVGIIEASLGENVVDLENIERSTRESTPCGLIRDPDTVRTPSSTTRCTCSSQTSRRIDNSMRSIPASDEINDFFAGEEEAGQKLFIEKFNFDPVKDEPLPGRFVWEKLDQ